jgi:hypothetical protein
LKKTILDAIQCCDTRRHSFILFTSARGLTTARVPCRFEAEHHERALAHVPYTRFRVDHQANRFGVLTTEEVKYAACTLLNTLLRDQRVAFKNPLLSEDPDGNRRRVEDQLRIYSMQFKQAQNVFGKGRQALSGKVGGMKDDVAIALQLGVYYSSREGLYT